MSKLGLHVTQGPRDNYGNYANSNPSVIVAANQGGALVEADNGHTYTIFRDTTVYLDAPPGIDQATAEEARSMADHYYRLLKEVWQLNPAHYYTVLNEPAGNDLSVMPVYVAFEQRMMELAEADGYKLCLLNLATGTPDDGRVAGGDSNGGIETWREIYLPHIRAGAARGHIYGRHAYDGGVQRALQEAAILGDVGMVITECGLDGGYGYRGDEAYVTWAIDVDQQMMQHPNLIGAALWTAGNWQGANNQTALPELTAYNNANPTPRWQPGTGSQVENLLYNHSFENPPGWTDMPPAPGNLINQQPVGWRLSWVEPGQPLYSDPNFMANGVPECVHKLSHQLPPEQRLGGSDALILDGSSVYKIFHAFAPFGAELSQEITGLTPGDTVLLTVPARVHRHGDNGPDWETTANIVLYIDDQPHTFYTRTLGDEEWYYAEVTTTVPESGSLNAKIQCESRYGGPKDFFFDNVSLVVIEGEDPPDERPRRIQHTIHLLPQDTTESELGRITKLLHPTRSAFTYSHDVVDAVLAHSTPEGRVVIWDTHRWDIDLGAWYGRWGTIIEYRNFNQQSLLDVPHKSQWGATADRFRGDCGPACVAMIAEYFGRPTTVNEATYACNQTDPLSTHLTNELKPGLESLGVNAVLRRPLTPADLQNYVDSGKPVLLLLDYEYISGRQDINYTSNHFVVIVGYDDEHLIVNDPDWWGDRVDEGHNFAIPYSEILQAMQATGAQGLVCTKQPAAQTIDILPYMLGNIVNDKGPLYEMQSAGGQERYQNQVENGALYVVKNSQWEKWSWDDLWIYLEMDTSPGPAPDYAERPGVPRWYELSEPNGLCRAWPRYMSAGQTWTQPVDHEVRFFYKDSCLPSPANSGTARNQATLFAHYDEIQIGPLVHHDVILIGREGGEKHYFGGGLGRLGWENNEGNVAYVTEIHGPGARPDNVREVVCGNN